MSELVLGAAAERENGGKIVPIAAAWHTALVLAIVAAWAYRGYLRAEQLRALVEVNRRGFYVQTIAAEWILLGIVLLGVWLYKAPFAAVLGKRWESASEPWKDFGIGLMFWLGSTVVLAIVGMLIHSNQTARVDFLLPHTGAERVIWILLSITAGICEEGVFRGYLQRQFLALTQSAPVAIVLSALAFGGAHAYQGWKMAAMIGLLGAMLGGLAQWRGTVRTGMIAHAWQDTFAGLIAGALRH